MSGIQLRGRAVQLGWRNRLAVAAVAVSISTIVLSGWSPLIGGGLQAGSATATPTTSLLESVGVFAQAGHDQVVFQFRNAVPGYTVTVATRPIHADPSGKVVTVAGNVVMQITMRPASGFDLTQPGAPATYTGPTRIALHGAAIVEVVQTGDFEGVLTWDVGLTEQVPFVAITASNPARLAVDFQDPAAAPTSPPSFTG